ncbi:alpha/beta hydrolase [Kerstersia sp.]|uniref:alpha/beta hydrolase n=1 Tax=Kerstersia sp. TaxID=1930783 RepID=UPI003F8E1ADC
MERANHPVYGTYDQAALDVQYNILGMIPGYKEIFARWDADSEAARSQARREGRLQVLRYGAFALQEIDFFSCGAALAPVVVFIHGGYWRSQDKSAFGYTAAAYQALGCHVALVNYRLAPAVNMDHIVDDLRASVAWLDGQAQALGIARDRIYIAGSSAGGHLVATLMATDWAALGVREDIVRGGCALSGIYELEPIRRCFLNAVVGLDVAQAHRNSPLYRLPQTGLPLILSVGGDESPEFQRQQETYAQACQERGVAVTVVPQPDGHHFDMIDRWCDPAQPLFREFAAMIQAA